MINEGTPTFQNVEAGEVIYQEGYVGNACIYVIAEGRVKITTKRDGMGAVVVDVLGKDDYFGEGALLVSKARGSTARALSFCRLLVIDPQTLNDELDRVSPVLRYLTRYLIRKNNRTEHHYSMDGRGGAQSDIVSYSHILSLMAQPEQHDVEDVQNVSVSIEDFLRQCQGITGHAEMRIMAMLRCMQTLGLVHVKSGNDLIYQDAPTLTSDAGVRQALVFSHLHIVEHARRWVEYYLNGHTPKETNCAELTAADTLINLERVLLSEKLLQGDIPGLTAPRITGQRADQIESVADLLLIDDLTLFDTVRATDAYDLAKMLVSSRHRAVSDRLLSVMSRAKQLEVSRIIQGEIVVEANDGADIQLQFIRLLKLLKSRRVDSSMRVAT
ncbi:hypothetical protein ASG35_11545 [Burkholderia sp. Leaf177]|uniref:cyclic nucleotide-binding domain-containing protein n=1 Tax=Burkholderia sp. Leaf177 TaxID=1736287 RepID=UPI0006F9AC09|nr:Crp/Fnr family transcriptional regulator [Burkholderia sp. Leaf177]KQR76914.1 hypothetical protein ASG35_11545 [Burkholderia sp. Leaf177]